MGESGLNDARVSEYWRWGKKIECYLFFFFFRSASGVLFFFLPPKKTCVCCCSRCGLFEPSLHRSLAFSTGPPSPYSITLFLSLPSQPLPGLYRHYKNGDVYKVLGSVLHTETSETMVLYYAVGKRNSHGMAFVRPSVICSWERWNIKVYMYLDFGCVSSTYPTNLFERIPQHYIFCFVYSNVERERERERERLENKKKTLYKKSTWSGIPTAPLIATNRGQESGSVHVRATNHGSSPDGEYSTWRNSTQISTVVTGEVEYNEEVQVTEDEEEEVEVTRISTAATFLSVVLPRRPGGRRST